MISEATYTADPVLLKANGHVCDSEANNYAPYTPDPVLLKANHVCKK